MLKPYFRNIILYLFLKYIMTYFVLMAVHKNFEMLDLSDIRNAGDVFYYLWLVLFLPAIGVLFFSVPLYFSFKIKSSILFTLFIILIFFIEYFVYVYYTSDKHIDTNGVYNGIISLLIFYLFFFKQINTFFKKHKPPAY